MNNQNTTSPVTYPDCGGTSNKTTTGKPDGRNETTDDRAGIRWTGLLGLFLSIFTGYDPVAEAKKRMREDAELQEVFAKVVEEQRKRLA